MASLRLDGIGGVLDFQTNPSGNPSRHWLGFIVLNNARGKKQIWDDEPKDDQSQGGPSQS